MTDVTRITWVLAIILSVVWIVLFIVSKGRRIFRGILCAFGLITLVWNFLLPTTVTDQWIKIDQEQNLNLYGIEVNENGDCVQYSALMGAREQNIIDVPLKFCHQVLSAQKPVDYIDLSTMQFYRIQALDYRAKYGIYVRTKEIFWDLLFKYWLILLMCIGTAHAVRNALCVNLKEQKENMEFVRLWQLNSKAYKR